MQITLSTQTVRDIILPIDKEINELNIKIAEIKTGVSANCSLEMYEAYKKHLASIRHKLMEAIYNGN